MNPLPSVSISSRLNAFTAAAVVTLTLLAAIDGLAQREGSLPQVARAAAAHSA
jgi:hypothetical protein